MTLSDAGAVFTVTVSAGSKTLISNPATLTIGPRSPNAQDIRFQLVASPATLPGYQEYIATDIDSVGHISSSYYNAIGTPLLIGEPNCGSVTNFTSCVWFFATFVPPIAGLDVNYWNGRYTTLASYLSGLPNNTVLSSMELVPDDYFFATSSIISHIASGFDGKFETEPSLAAVANAVAVDGAAGRVVTAISPDGANLSFVSYGWTGDAAGAYETEVASASVAQLPAIASQLAADGYIITACGGNTAQGFVLVGTRVRGDSLARPILVIPANASPLPISNDGYATVAYISAVPNEAPVWIGEK